MPLNKETKPSGALENVEYIFIAITFMFTQK